MKYALTIVIFLSAFSVNAQQGFGRIEGKVCDTSENPIPDIIVILEDSLGKMKAEISDANGAFAFYPLPYQKYSLTAKQLGYKPIMYTGIQVANNEAIIKTFKLERGVQFINGPDPEYFPVFKEEPGTTTYRRDDIIHMAVPR